MAGLFGFLTGESKWITTGLTPEQKKIVKYFQYEGGGCFRVLKDDSYDQLVLAKLNSIDFKSRALELIGLDEDQLREIPPLFLHGFNFRDDKSHLKFGKDLRWRASRYDATWLFFSDTQIYMYKYTFDMRDGSMKEVALEYFYKDITNFMTTDEKESHVVAAKAKKGCLKGLVPVRILREYSSFLLVVPSDTFFCSISGVPNAEAAIGAMKQKLREKKLI
ncbi:MAG: hypothetical protein LBN12_08600 [Clostridiales Family XIII bacterium]|jgi:hypothetical protein|nr:hypothetical protein [Clostridiales Family XIII bacterium]